MASAKEEQERIRSLLLDTVTLLCKNGLTFRKQLKVQGLLGITLDEDNVFIVHFDENLGEVTVEPQEKCSSTVEGDSSKNSRSEHSNRTERSRDRKRKATVDISEPEEKVHIKTEANDDVVLLEEPDDIKPVHIQALPSYSAEGMFSNYGQMPLNQLNQMNHSPQIMPGIMNSSNSTSFSPNVLPNPSSLQQHHGLSYPDPSQQMTPEKVGFYCFFFAVMC